MRRSVLVFVVVWALILVVLAAVQPPPPTVCWSYVYKQTQDSLFAEVHAPRRANGPTTCTIELQ